MHLKIITVILFNLRDFSFLLHFSSRALLSVWCACACICMLVLVAALLTGLLCARERVRVYV